MKFQKYKKKKTQRSSSRKPQGSCAKGKKICWGSLPHILAVDGFRQPPETNSHQNRSSLQILGMKMRTIFGTTTPISWKKYDDIVDLATKKHFSKTTLQWPLVDVPFKHALFFGTVKNTLARGDSFNFQIKHKSHPAPGSSPRSFWVD